MSEKPKNKPSQHNKWFIGLTIITVLCVIGFFFWFVDVSEGLVEIAESVDGFDLRDEEARDFMTERFSSLPLPDDATDIHVFARTREEEYELFLRFSANPESIETWLSENDFCFAQLSPGVGIRESNGDMLLWWFPNLGSSRSGSGECGSNPYYMISIDQRDESIWIVYLYSYFQRQD